MQYFSNMPPQIRLDITVVYISINYERNKFIKLYILYVLWLFFFFALFRLIKQICGLIFNVKLLKFLTNLNTK